MQALFRTINIIFSPILTLVLASRFAGITLGGKDAGDALGAAFAGLIVLVVEFGLTQGPKYSALLRRWLDPRAVFEGIWIQQVDGGGANRIAVYSLLYERGDDTFDVSGKAYSTNGKPWAKWHSTHLFIDVLRLKATYRWEGEVIGDAPADAPISDSDKSGLTNLELRRPASFSQPMSGHGEVFHVGEARRIRFGLKRVTNRYLKELNLKFTVRDLLTNAQDEELMLIKAALQRS